MEKKQTPIKYIEASKAAELLNLKKEQLTNAFKSKDIKGYWISNTTENSFFLEFENLIKYCTEQNIDSKSLINIKIDPISRV